jgi:hypothetical protein
MTSPPSKPDRAKTNLEIQFQTLPQPDSANREANPEIRRILRRTDKVFQVLITTCILITIIILLKLLWN